MDDNRAVADVPGTRCIKDNGVVANGWGIRHISGTGHAGTTTECLDVSTTESGFRNCMFLSHNKIIWAL